MNPGAESLNIVIVGPAWPLRGGGLASFNERLARAFMQDGHKVKIITFSLQYPEFLFPGSTQMSTEKAPEDLDIEVMINSINPLTWRRTGKYLKKLSPDIIVVRYWIPFMAPCLGTILKIASKNNHSRVICIADNIIAHEPKPGYDKLTRFFLKQVDACITMSQQVLNDLRTFTKTLPATLVPHPLYDNFGDKISKEEARAFLGIELDKPVMLFFGFIRKYKGLDILYEALHLLKISYPQITPYLLVAGEYYDDKEYYEHLAKTLDIQSLIIDHTGFVKSDQIKYYLCAADVVVQPYRHATQSGVTPLAYHFEVPMIVTNVGGLADMVPHGVAGLVCSPSSASLAECIREFYITGPDAFLPGIRKEKIKYSWQNLVDAILLAGVDKL
ncbi:MAG: glycosyltransferase [Ferruginibacter sp.]